MLEMVEKPLKRVEFREVIYSVEHWKLLERFRAKAVWLMEALEKFNLEATVHGSVARGDVTAKSDVDVFVPNPTSSFVVETALEQAGVPVNRRFIVQATPTYAMKAYIEIDPNTCVSFPLMQMRKIEREFYRFGGEATLKNLRDGLRVSGVDKRLMLIEPTDKGHRETTIIGCEEQIAKRLGISIETVFDRVHALLRRDEVGRTGVFIKKELTENETFERAMERLAEQNPAVRRRLKAA